MAIEFKLSLESIEADCGRFTLRDETTYGGGEAERSELAVYIAGWKKNNDGEDTELPIYPEDTDPFVVERWATESDKDGWHVFPMYGLYQWDSGTSYVTGDATYHQDLVYKALRANINADPSTSGSDWVAIENLSEIDESGNIEYGLPDINTTCRSEKCYAKVVSKAALDSCNNSCDTLYGKLYREVDVLLQGANVKCQQEKNAEFESIIRALENVCDSYGTCSNC